MNELWLNIWGNALGCAIFSLISWITISLMDPNKRTNITNRFEKILFKIFPSVILFVPLLMIVYTFYTYDAEKIKEFILTVVIQLISLITNICILFYFRLKRSEKRVAELYDIINRLLSVNKENESLKE